MGSCISKCKPKVTMKQLPPCNLDLNNLVHDKLVIIPQPPLTTAPSLSLNNKISPYPPSPSPSTSSLSCLSSTTTTSSASTATSRSSVFSDEYLWSCYKQNPHVVRINSLKANALSSPGRALRLNSPVRVTRSMPQKRVRPTSPSPVRQKSFRKEERPPSRSPSRRFGGEKRRLAPTAVAPARGNNYLNSPARGCAMKKEISCIHRISSKIDEVAAREAVSRDQDFDSGVANAMEDIDNPLISLDCFIFL